jgi:hypothetical protein
MQKEPRIEREVEVFMSFDFTPIRSSSKLQKRQLRCATELKKKI